MTASRFTKEELAALLKDFTDEELLSEMYRRDPLLDGNQTARELDMEPGTLRSKNSRGSHALKRYKFEKNGPVKYRFSDVREYIRKQQVPA